MEKLPDADNNIIGTPEPEKKPHEKENLRKRAFLNSFTSLLDYAVGQITGLITSPIIVRGLGGSVYGVWQMLTQFSSYARIADTRASQVLKWSVAKKRGYASDDELRSDLTTALVVITAFLPVMLIAAAVFVWYAPYITKVDAQYFSMIRITTGILASTMILTWFFDLFESVLRGMNLGYKKMGIRSIIIIIGAVLKILAITQGYGLIGLAGVQMIVTIITGISFYTIVKKHVPWFGFGKTNFRRATAFTQTSGWYMANSIADVGLNNTDRVLLGYLTTPVLVAHYSLTQFLPLAVQGIIAMLIIGVTPGIGKLLGLNDHEKVNSVLRRLDNFILVTITASAVTIILFNENFLRVWIGAGYFPGTVTNVLIMLMVMLSTFIKKDGFIISASLDQKKRVLLTLTSAIVFFILCYITIPLYSINGLVGSFIAAKFILFIGQRKIIGALISRTQNMKVLPVFISILMVISAGLASRYMPQLNLFEIALYAIITFVMALGIFFYTGMSQKNREELVELVLSLKILKAKK